MANQFFVDPTYGRDPTAMRGISDVIMRIGEQREQKKKEEQALIAQEQMQSDIVKALTSGDELLIQETAVRYPQMSELMYKQIGIMEDRHKSDLSGFARDILTSDPASVKQKYEDRILDLKSKGRDATQTEKSYADYLANPEAELEDVRLLYAGIDPEGSKALSETLKGTQKEKELDLKQQSIDVRKQENELRRSEQALLKETNELKRDKLRIEVDAKRDKLERERKEAQEAQAAALGNLDNSISTVDRLLEHPGLEAAVGISATPGFTLPGSPKADFMAELDAFDAQNFLTAIKQMKGMGALSDAEGKKVSAAVGAINPNMSEKAFKRSLRTIKEGFESARAKITGEEVMTKEVSEELSIDDLVNKYAN